MKNVEIVYQDEWLMVIGKPYGVVVNRAESVKESTVQDWVEESFDFVKQYEGDLDAEVFVSRSGVAHRLDKDTSGVMLVSKNPKVLEGLMSQFKNREIKKEYVAMVHGRLEPTKGGWMLPIERSSIDRQKFKVGVDGKMAETEYTVVGYYEASDEISTKGDYQGGFSEVNLFPKTGRTHQLRVHLKHIKHPIVGDKVYLGKKMRGNDGEWCSRHYLHAKKIGFMHPVLGKWVEYESELPKDLVGVKKMLVKR